MLRNFYACSFALKCTLLISLPVWAVQMLAAHGMNNAGRIVGKGLYNGVEQAFLLNPAFSAPAYNLETGNLETGVPEPASLWLVGVPALAYFAFRARRR